MAIDQLSYMNLPGCIKLSNGTVDLIVTTAVGPRILFYGRTSGQNHLGQFPDNSVKTRARGLEALRRSPPLGLARAFPC